MGSGRPRSNIDIVSAGRQVVTDDGAIAISCFVDEVLPADVDSRVGVDGRRVGVVAEVDGSLTLLVAGEMVASLTSSPKTDRLLCCIQRGFSFAGAVVGIAAVRVWTES